VGLLAPLPGYLELGHTPVPDEISVRFLETSEVAQAMEDAGLTVEARLERTSYPGEADTRRGYLLGRRGAR